MQLYALIDCNNFFASCERVFKPNLLKQPIVILSNNDGCVIARSNEAKALGIPMGAPFFQYEKLCKQAKVNVFSSNFILYGNISNRVMQIINMSFDEVEVYSIDEAFIKFEANTQLEAEEKMFALNKAIFKFTSIPTSIGIAKTKTLAKMASKIAKDSKHKVFYMHNKDEKYYYKNFDVADIWGVGKNIAKKLYSMGIRTAEQMIDLEPKIMRKLYGVSGERLCFELRGSSCYELGLLREAKKSIITSRSFGKAVVNIDELYEAVSHYAARACEKMRKQNTKARGFYIFLAEKHGGKKKYIYSEARWFQDPCDDTIEIIRHAKSMVDSSFNLGARYYKAGVVLLELVDKQTSQLSLFEVQDNLKMKNLFSLVDNINSELGQNTIFFAAQGTKRPWMMKSNQRSPNYTSSWSDLPLVR